MNRIIVGGSLKELSNFFILYCCYFLEEGKVEYVYFGYWVFLWKVNGKLLEGSVDGRVWILVDL